VPIQPDPRPRLYQSTELLEVLHMTQEKIDSLIVTDQLHPIRIAGEVRFDSREIDALIYPYLPIAKRKKTYVQ
jgi:hypothetical protein